MSEEPQLKNAVRKLVLFVEAVILKVHESRYENLNADFASQHLSLLEIRTL